MFLNLSFSIKESALDETLQILSDNKEEIGYQEIEHETGLSKVSIVGSGMVSNPGVAAQMFSVLADRKIQVKMVSTSEIKVSVIIDEESTIRALKKLHKTFKLD